MARARPQFVRSTEPKICWCGKMFFQRSTEPCARWNKRTHCSANCARKKSSLKGADAIRGTHFTEDHKEKIGTANRGRKVSETTKERLSAAALLRPRPTPETIQQLQVAARTPKALERRRTSLRNKTDIRVAAILAANAAVCGRCVVLKDLSEFGKDSRSPIGKKTLCRSCENEAARERYHRDIGKSRMKSRGKSGNPTYRAKRRVYSKAYRARPDARALAQAKNARRRATVMGAIHLRISRAVRLMLIRGKNGKKTFDILGYTSADLAAHIERQFSGRMSWPRFIRGEIHIDHIVPKASFTFSGTDDSEFIACWALSNLRPSWAVDNMKKGDRREFLL